MKEIIDGISIRLNEIFGDEYDIYLEEVDQDLQTPCFFITLVDFEDKNMISDRKFRQYAFTIVYIPSDISGHRMQFAEVADKLFDNFDSIELADGSLIYTFDRVINIVGDVLEFTVLFKLYKQYENEAEEVQEHLEMSVI